MKLAVKFYRDCSNPKGIAGHWPAEVMEIGDGVEPPAPWVTMSQDQYEEYREKRWVETKCGPNLVDSLPEGAPRTQARSSNWANFALLLAGCALGFGLAKIVIHVLGVRLG